MKTILLPFRDDEWSESALRTSHAIARQHQSHIECLFVVPEPQFVSGGIPIPDLYLMQMAEDGEQLIAQGYTKHAFVKEDGKVVRPPKFFREFVNNYQTSAGS